LLNDMAAQRAGFQNAAQKQAFEQAQGKATFANAAQQQDFTQQGLRAQFANQTQGQRMAMAQAKLDAENNARKQFLSEQYAQRQAPINEISALMSGSQVQQPQWAQTSSSQIPTTDYAGLVNNRFSQDMANYQQSSQNFNQIMGGIFGAVAGLTRSDKREKDVGPKLGTVFAAGPDGERKLPVHEYKYKDDPAAISHIGPMAQDVEKVDRGAVKTIAGTKYIDMTRMGSILRDKKEARRHG
ncbi:MAG TPA: tail fiber domain-containing protein, partial [Polyangia bacterium]|nr:tail fiber domain-containing protein [Polyangia bacterium]